MTKNEIELLEDWIKYHGYLFGLENIHVLDGSDDPRVFEVYAKYKPFGLHVHFSSVGLNGLAEELTKLMQANKGTDNFLIKLDTDEFLAHTLPTDHDRNGYEPNVGLEEVSNMLDNAAFKDVLDALPVTGQRYKASFIAWSHPSLQYLPQPARELVDFTPLQLTNLKSFFHSDSFVSVDLGSHNGVSTENNGTIDTYLALIHYHSTSVEDSIRRALQVLVSHEYIEVSDSVEAQRKKLSTLRAQGVLKSSHKMDLYLQYLESLENKVPLDPNILNAQHPFFRPTDRSVEIDLVRKTLNAIDQRKYFDR